jgi:hypothetical protein
MIRRRLEGRLTFPIGHGSFFNLFFCIIVYCEPSSV